ncbi:MAG: hypothetical protein AAF392_02445 [Bacteroidota bacterium]
MLENNVFVDKSMFIHRYMTDHERSILHRYLHENTTAADLTRSLLFLSKLLYRPFGKPVYVLIDEYDTPNSA